MDTSNGVPNEVWSRLQPLYEWGAAPENQKIVGSKEALRWLYRQHRDRLHKSKAVYELRGRKFVDPEVFIAELLEISAAAEVA